MIRYLLDTNILSDVIKNPQGKAASYMASLDKSSLLTSIIVASEMRYGVEKRKSAILRERVDLILQMIHVAPLELGVDWFYGQMRMQLEQQGKMIGANDLLIAAHALALDAVLVTDKVREFERIKQLNIENWL